jgi:ectoine hydroxylase-related dioxygenase (phytanoyl-CoA dioxygenase family)
VTAKENSIDRFLGGRCFSECRAQFDRAGYLIFKNVLSPATISEIRVALAPWLAKDLRGRNDFEGMNSNRIYAMLAKSPLFAELATHPLALAFAEAELGPDCLLSACLAISLQPGESAQPWHFDDSHFGWPRPRPSLGVSTFWAIDDTTDVNGATELLPGSHLWGEEAFPGSLTLEDFANKELRAAGDDPAGRADAIKAIMPAGSLMVAKGTLWHRGGANNSDKARLIITPQYCPGWTRQLENMCLAVPPEIAKTLSPRARQLLGYSIRPPFMGYVDGMHPRRLLED